jgi:hypothetical protein
VEKSRGTRIGEQKWRTGDLGQEQEQKAGQESKTARAECMKAR